MTKLETKKLAGERQQNISTGQALAPVGKKYGAGK